MFQRPSLRGLFLEELIFGGAYVRREICVSKSTELEVNLLFLLCFSFFALPVWGLIFGGANFRNFRVYLNNFSSEYNFLFYSFVHLVIALP